MFSLGELLVDDIPVYKNSVADFNAITNISNSKLSYALRVIGGEITSRTSPSGSLTIPSNATNMSADYLLMLLM